MLVLKICFETFSIWCLYDNHTEFLVEALKCVKDKFDKSLSYYDFAMFKIISNIAFAISYIHKIILEYWNVADLIWFYYKWQNEIMYDFFSNLSIAQFMALSATYRKTYIQNMNILISYIQVKSLLADTLCTIFVYCIFVCTGKKCVS